MTSASGNKKANAKAKPKLSKEERRAKYTELARKRSAKDRERATARNSICFQCRQRGHTVAHCPNSSAAVKVASCCYKCGSTEHSLAKCPKRGQQQQGGSGDDPLPYATCFICQSTGHLASKCPQNTKGIYVNGGCCKECGSNQHRVTECPERRNRKEKAERSDVDHDEEEFLDLLPERSDQGMRSTDGSTRSSSSKQTTKRRVVKF